MATFTQTQSFDRVPIRYVGAASSDGRRVVFPLAGLLYASVQADDATGDGTGWTTAVLTVKVGNCPEGPFYAVPAGAVTLATGSRLSSIINVGAYAYLAVDITTGEGSDRFVKITLCGKGER
jgi:hypothetical protein